ncbi:MAG: serine/threonine-protein kinase, partial [Planctomycetota bacterium]|nr:serine/threonine-protein kinase [Planctomycetota bacterium]
YRILRTLGRGGMGVVYQGVNLQTEEAVAVKVLAAALIHDPGLRQRFEGEIEALRKLNHPNIVRLLGFGEEEGRLFYSMEYVDGRSLEHELLAGRHFDWRETAEMGIAICAALKHAHDRGVIHRDIKPANLLIANDGTVKLSDFGIARLFGQTRLTAAGNVLGTADFMAPEQADARPVGPRSDLYSLGCVLYTVLANRPPLVANTFVEMLKKQRTEMPLPVRQYAPSVPEEFQAILIDLLAKDPAKRIRNAAILARRLSAMIHGLTRQEGAAGEVDERALSPKEREFVSAPTIGDTPHPSGDPLEAQPDPVEKTRQAEPGELASGARATEVFQPSAAGMAGAAGGAGGARGRFTEVEAEDLDQVETEDEPPPWISVQTWVLLAAAAAVALAVWYLLQPPSADRLYKQIMQKTADKTIDSYRDAEPKIAQFLEHYSGDPRSGRLRAMLTSVELYLRERRFDLQAGGRGDLGTLLPIERAYVEALNYMRIEPELGIARLTALIALYDNRQDRTKPFDTTGPTGMCLELARRRLEQMRLTMQRSTADDLNLIRKQLAKADGIESADPDRAREIRQAALDVYGNKPWAKPVLEEARRTLGGDPDATGQPARRDNPDPDNHPPRSGSNAP